MTSQWQKPSTSLGHMPRGAWEFDQSVAACCVDMMARSVPGYGRMRELVKRFARVFIVPGHAVIELGAANGEGIAELAFEHRGSKFLAVDHSPSMLSLLHERFEHSPNVRVVDRDLSRAVLLQAKDYACVVLSVLVLQFVDPHARPSLIQEAFDSLISGGAMILVEKVRSRDPKVAVHLALEHLSQKHENGYSWAEIEAKVKSLDGKLTPLSIEANLGMLREAGFEADLFWHDTNFAGFLAVKP